MAFLEPVYKNSLLIELQHCGVDAKLEVPTEVFYRGKPVGKYRVDLLVGGKIIVEVKATKAVSEADERQLLNYLKATSAEVGFLLHFGPKPWFRRMIYTNDRKQLPPLASWQVP